MGTGFSNVAILDEPTIDPSLLQAVTGESSSRPLIPESGKFLLINELCVRGSLSNLPLEAVDAIGATPVDGVSLPGHTYHDTIGADSLAEIFRYKLHFLKTNVVC